VSVARVQVYNRNFPLHPVTSILFKNMLRAARQMLGMGQEGEMSAALAWFAEQCDTRPGTSYGQRVDDRNMCTGIFYMSPEMKASFTRNGQFIMVDATCKTNRFGMPLILLVGANEINKSAIFAIGLLMTESIEMYTWFLWECRKAVGQPLRSHMQYHPLCRLLYVYSAVDFAIDSALMFGSTLLSTVLSTYLR
jgi:hypothetical protein